MTALLSALFGYAAVGAALGVPVALALESPAGLLLPLLALTAAPLSAAVRAAVAVAGRARLTAVDVGSGPEVAAFGRRVAVRLRYLPFGGGVDLLEPRAEGAARLRRRVLQSGPYANLAAAAAAVLALPPRYAAFLAVPHVLNAALLPRDPGLLARDPAAGELAVARLLHVVTGGERYADSLRLLDAADAELAGWYGSPDGTVFKMIPGRTGASTRPPASSP